MVALGINGHIQNALHTSFGERRQISGVFLTAQVQPGLSQSQEATSAAEKPRGISALSTLSASMRVACAKACASSIFWSANHRSHTAHCTGAVAPDACASVHDAKLLMCARQLDTAVSAARCLVVRFSSSSAKDMLRRRPVTGSEQESKKLVSWHDSRRCSFERHSEKQRSEIERELGLASNRINTTDNKQTKKRECRQRKRGVQGGMGALLQTLYRLLHVERTQSVCVRRAAYGFHCLAHRVSSARSSMRNIVASIFSLSLTECCSSGLARSAVNTPLSCSKEYG
jgi:hypothetical protein